MSGELGKASLDLDANLGPFERNVAAAETRGDSLRDSLGKLAAIADVAEAALNDVKMSGGAESRITAQEIISGVKGVGEESRAAAFEIDRVKLDAAQAAETVAAGDLIDHKLKQIRDNAVEASAAMDGVAASTAVAGASSGASSGLLLGGTSPSLLGVGIGAATLLAPAAAPAAIGLLASIPTLAAAGAGALGVLALAFQGVFKAIGGDKKAFDDLTASQKQFVLLIRSLDGWFERLKQVAAQSVFPGLTKGLKAALSPGTLNAITTAVVQVGRALGAAGAAWGKYFGSDRFQHIFGPLMQAAAHNIGVLSDTFLHLFDALGVIARAAIPFTNFLTGAIDKGAKFADTWLRARDATGQLAGAMREARASLTLVAKLVWSLLGVVFALGKALYPVAKVAVKALTDGLDFLSGVIHRNQAFIRGLVGGALKVLIFVVKEAARGVGVLFHGLQAIIGRKAMIVAAIAAIGVALLLALGPESAVVLGVIVAIGLIKDHWGSIVRFFKNLGHEINAAFDYAWYLLKVGAIKAALAMIEPFSHLPSFLGGWARDAKNAMQSQLDKLHAPNMAWGGYARAAGVAAGAAFSDGFYHAIRGGAVASERRTFDALAKQFQGRTSGAGDGPHHQPKPGTHAWYMKYLGYDPTTQPAFGTPPPFTTTTGTHPKHNHLTAAQMMQQHLQYQLDLTKLAVQNATQGTAAWDKAVRAEEKALKAEIRYWDKRAHNRALSVAARDAALKKELAYQRELSALLKPIHQAAVANEAQFLAAFKAIQNEFGGNASPIPPSGSKKTDTHLYDIKNEARKTNDHLSAIRGTGRFPGTQVGLDSTLAATS